MRTRERDKSGRDAFGHCIAGIGRTVLPRKSPGKSKREREREREKEREREREREREGRREEKEGQKRETISRNSWEPIFSDENTLSSVRFDTTPAGANFVRYFLEYREYV